MTVIEAAKAITGIGERKRERDLQRFLVGAVEQYLDRCLHYQEEKQPEAVAVWRNATFEEQDEAAAELLKEVMP